VNAVNDAPSAADHTFTTDEDTAITNGTLTDYASDVDAGTTLDYFLISDVSHGTLTLNSDGTFTYTPAVNFNGTDSFTWKVSDGTADSNIATATITVSAMNDVPAAADHTFTIDEDTVLNDSLTAYAEDVDMDSLTYAKASDPAHGTVTVNADGTFTYTPAVNFNGTDNFNWKVSDGTAESNIATASIMVNAVNDVPTLTNSTENGIEDTMLNLTAADFSDQYNDAENDLLNRIQIATLPDPAHGTLRLNDVAITAGDEIAAADLDNIIFVPSPNFNGNAIFTWKASDGTSYCDTAVTMTLAIAAVDDVPEAPANVTATAGNGQATVTFDAPADDGGSPVTGYIVTSNPEGKTAQGSASPITITGLTNGTSYTFTVKAVNGAGTGLESAATIAVIQT
jgi:VCBS repeat-containing protein